MENVLMDKEKIKTVIPHREPMLMIDNVLEMKEGENIRTDFYLDPDAYFFKGHFPGAPVMPGVITVESMAQTADVLLLSIKEYVGKTPFFIGIDQVKFKSKIEPEDRIEIEARISKVNKEKGVITCDVAVYNKGEVSTTGLVTLAMR